MDKRKFEYKRDVFEVNVMKVDDPAQALIEHLNELGEEGWEAVQIDNHYYSYDRTHVYTTILKRKTYDL